MSEIYKNTNSVINVGAVTNKDWNKNQNIFYIKISIKTRSECQKWRLNLEKKLNLKMGGSVVFWRRTKEQWDSTGNKSPTRTPRTLVLTEKIEYLKPET